MPLCGEYAGEDVTTFPVRVVSVPLVPNGAGDIGLYMESCCFELDVVETLPRTAGEYAGLVGEYCADELPYVLDREFWLPLLVLPDGL